MSRAKPLKGRSLFAPETAEGPAGIYVHIPFCRTKCPYCSFVSYPGVEKEVQNNYIRALGRQAQKIAEHPWSRSRKFQSLFIGGGNPPTIDSGRLAGFIGACLEAFDFSLATGKKPEVSLEANPNSVNPKMLENFLESGVNRLSLGVQVLSDSMLKKIGRKHSVEDSLKAYELARNAGFTNINLDLMYGLPGQDIASWEKTLQQAVALLPEHFSVYELTVEAGTPFAEQAAEGTLDLPPEDEILGMFEYAGKVLAAAGYSHYEISNYGRRGFACRHNINYWENGSYVGLGAGAVSCYSGVRFKNETDPQRFIQMLENDITPYAEAEFLPIQARFRESVIMGLRMTAGVSVARLKSRFGLVPTQYYGETLFRLKSQKLLEEVEGRLRFTQKGMVLANMVMAQLV